MQTNLMLTYRYRKKKGKKYKLIVKEATKNSNNYNDLSQSVTSTIFFFKPLNGIDRIALQILIFYV